MSLSKRDREALLLGALFLLPYIPIWFLKPVLPFYYGLWSTHPEAFAAISSVASIVIYIAIHMILKRHELR